MRLKVLEGKLSTGEIESRFSIGDKMLSGDFSNFDRIEDTEDFGKDGLSINDLYYLDRNGEVKDLPSVGGTYSYIMGSLKVKSKECYDKIVEYSNNLKKYVANSHDDINRFLVVESNTLESILREETEEDFFSDCWLTFENKLKDVSKGMITPESRKYDRWSKIIQDTISECCIAKFGVNPTNIKDGSLGGKMSGLKTEDDGKGIDLLDARTSIQGENTDSEIVTTANERYKLVVNNITSVLTDLYNSLSNDKEKAYLEFWCKVKLTKYGISLLGDNLEKVVELCKKSKNVKELLNEAGLEYTDKNILDILFHIIDGSRFVDFKDAYKMGGTLNNFAYMVLDIEGNPHGYAVRDKGFQFFHKRLDKIFKDYILDNSNLLSAVSGSSVNII